MTGEFGSRNKTHSASAFKRSSVELKGSSAATSSSPYPLRNLNLGGTIPPGMSFSSDGAATMGPSFKSKRRLSMRFFTTPEGELQEESAGGGVPGAGPEEKRKNNLR